MMGIYYAAVDTEDETIFYPPGHFATKIPGLYHPNNPFPSMVVMKNTQGYNYQIWSDNDYYHLSFKDITQEVYDEYLKIYPQFNEPKNPPKPPESE